MQATARKKTRLMRAVRQNQHSKVVAHKKQNFELKNIAELKGAEIG